jgi:hypothetical protein
MNCEQPKFATESIFQCRFDHKNLQKLSQYVKINPKICNYIIWI